MAKNKNNPHDMKPYFVTHTHELQQILARHQEAEIVFLDTEFIRETTYYPIPAVIQFYISGEDVYLLDVTSKDLDIQIFIDFLKPEHRLKVFHCGRQDIEIFYHHYGYMPMPVFDTQIAAAYLGYGEQQSFETLVKSITHHSLDKSQQRTNWINRPLTTEQILYAAKDVFYLALIYKHLYKQLEKKNRLDWVQKEMLYLQDEKIYHLDPEHLWKKIKQRPHTAKERFILQALWLYREQQAITHNVIRNYIALDDNLLLLSQKNIQDVQNFQKYFTGKKKQAFHDSVFYNQAWDFYQKTKADALNIHFEEKSCLNISHHNDKIIGLIQIYLKQISENHQVAPRLLCSPQELSHYFTHHVADFLTGWKYDLFGQDILAIIAGEKALSYDGKNIILMLVPTSQNKISELIE